jgi:hypothetical protein
MPRILITGIPYTEKEAISDFVLKELKRFKLKFIYKNADEEPILKSDYSKASNTILTCTLVTRTDDGFRFVNGNVLKNYKPDITILLEAETRDPEKQVWQEISRCHLISNINGELKIIKMRRDNIKKPIKEISNFLKKIF